MIKKRIWVVNTVHNWNGFSDIYESEERAQEVARNLVREYEITGELKDISTLETYSLMCYASENDSEQEELEEGLYINLGWESADTQDLKNDWYFKVGEESEKSFLDMSSYTEDETIFVADGEIQSNCGVLSQEWKNRNWDALREISYLIDNLEIMCDESCTSFEMKRKISSMIGRIKPLIDELQDMEDENDR